MSSGNGLCSADNATIEVGAGKNFRPGPYDRVAKLCGGFNASTGANNTATFQAHILSHSGIRMNGGRPGGINKPRRAL